MEIRGGVYAIVNRRTGEFYIGATADFRRRWSAHKTALRYRNSLTGLQTAWDLDGADGLSFEPLCEMPVPDAEAAEQRLLDRLHGHPKCLNRSRVACVPDDAARSRKSAALRGRTASAETRERRRRAMAGRLFTEEHKAALREGFKGRPANNKGKPMSAEQRAKMSVIAKARPVGSFTGRTHTPEARAKISAAAQGRPGSFTGRTHSPEAIEKMRERRLAYWQRQTIATRGGAS